MGRVVRSRLESVEANLFEIFEKNLQEKKSLLIGNFGSGRDINSILFHHFRGRIDDWTILLNYLARVL